MGKAVFDHNKYDSLLLENAMLYNIEFALLKAQVRQESGFNPNAVSPAGAKGLAQFMSPTWKEWGRGGNVFSPEDNLDAQARYMVHLLDRYNNDMKLALYAYNWGMGNVDKWLKGKKKMPKETIQYYEKIKSYYDEYIRLETKDINETL